MSVTNNLLIFGDNTTNKMSHSTYADANQRINGVQATQVISSILHNTVLRSLSIIQRSLISSLGIKSSGVGGTWDTDITEENAQSQFEALFEGLNVNTAKTLLTSRTFKIADSNSHEGTAQSFDGSGNIVLPLPATIQASFIGDLTGTASNASKINNKSFDMSFNANTGVLTITYN